MHYALRPLCADDEPFLWQMHYYAARVNEEEGRTIDDMKKDPVMPNYVIGWGRPGDLGFVAVDGDSGAPLGAAWLRLPTADGGGYSASDSNTPELAIAVQPAFIGQGIGTRLMEELINAARGQYPAVILNVRKESPAQKLYARLGFTTVREIDNRVGGRSLEMICKLEMEVQSDGQKHILNSAH